MKKLLSLIMALCLVFALAACTGNNENVAVEPTDATVEENETLVVGMTIYEPMNYEDENGELTGFDTEFAQLFAEKMGCDVEFVEIDWGTKFITLEAGEIDCIWNGMTITEEAMLNADVSNPYVKNAQVVVVNGDKADEYATVESLAGLTIAAEMGSAGAAAVTECNIDCNLVEVDVQTTALLQVATGKADACVIDITMANSMLQEGTDFASLAVSQELTGEEYGVAFKKGSPLTEEFNTFMAEAMADGTLDELAAKYNLALVK